MAPDEPIVVIGAGLSGLACAHALQKRGYDILVFEHGSRAGGVIGTRSRDGFLFETGPQSFGAAPALLALVADLKLSGELVEAPSKSPRFVLLDGRLREVPLSPQGILSSSLLGLKTKSTFMSELFGKTSPPEPDESIADFVRRKFTPELLDRLVGPFVSGVFAGDPELLSLRAAFPQAYMAEKSIGSVIRGLKQLAKEDSSREAERQPRSTLLSFRAGNETLTRALAAGLGPALRLGASVRRVCSAPEGTFVVTVLEADHRTREISARAVVFATPTFVAGDLLGDVLPGAQPPLAEISYAPVAVISLGYRRADVGHDLRGFGFLIPRSAKLRTLGCVWNSSLFPNRAPDTHVLVTSFVGGATDRPAASLPDGELTRLVHSEIAPILSLKGSPVISEVTTYSHAIPQYNLGHTLRVIAIETGCASAPGLYVVGNYLHGPSVGACVERAMKVANQIQIGYNS